MKKKLSLRWYVVVFSVCLIAAPTVLFYFFAAQSTQNVLADVTENMYSDKITGAMEVLKEYIKQEYGSLKLQNSQLVDENGRLVEGRTDVVDKISQHMNVIATIFKKSGERFVGIATSIREDGRATVYLEKDNPAYKSILQKKRYIGEAEFYGTRYIVCYEPVLDEKGNIIGALLVGTPKTAVNKIISSAKSVFLKQSLILIVILTGVGVILASLLMYNILVKPFVRILESVEKVTQGDLTYRISTEYTAEEFERLAENLDHMADELSTIVRNIVDSSKTISEAVETLMSTTEEVGATAEELSSQMEGINQAAQSASASIEELSSGAEEVAASAQNVSNAAQTIDEKAGSVREAASKGDEAVKIISDMVSQIQESATSTQKVMEDLLKSAENINQVVEVISSIAEQTNLLALNAAIEAARAGEAGRGFAVVADEIRKLAEESKDATVRISQILSEVQKGAVEANEEMQKTIDNVVKTTEQSKKVVDELANILREVGEISGMIENLAASSQELSAAAEEMSSAADTAAKSVTTIAEQMEEMDRALKQQADANQSIISIAERLSNIAQILSERVKRFKIE
ncbi:methyl-accepting chemotaxis protein [Thermotoga sp. KOL6]|uniref:methyl-accepting chemotaxis protein n=1 Tax=Thermotoga sp. KOL6 TaxID=126741 RepID=UPI000C787EA6|nr:methyl-accepting chemotaxis protein [Thermotoga sp. KOL6]PLV59749.1 hypothetical protein AS005_00150 [Thermotoga sp. KOL6]